MFNWRQPNFPRHAGEPFLQFGGRPRIWQWDVSVLFEPRDLWVGLFWDRRRSAVYDSEELHLYVCVLPALLVHVRMWFRPRGAR